MILRLSLTLSVALPLTGVLVAQQPNEKAVLQAAQRLFDGMEKRDSAALRAALLPGVQFVAVVERDGQSTSRVTSAEDFIAAIPKRTAVPRERMQSPEVRIDGGIATVWAPYDFHNGESFSHCGVDSFQLVRTETGWKIAGIVYTVRTKGCPPM